MTYILYILSARFQLENWSAPAWLDSARNLHSSGSLEPENSSSNSSLTNDIVGFSPDVFTNIFHEFFQQSYWFHTQKTTFWVEMRWAAHWTWKLHDRNKNTIADEPSHKKAWKQRRKRKRGKSGLTRSYSSLSNKRIETFIFFRFIQNWSLSIFKL